VTGAFGVGLGAAGAAALVLQHRAVSRAQVTNEAVTEEGLALPAGIVHHFVDVPDGGRLHAMERGRGRPLVLLHGLMLSSALWVHQLRDLADRHRVITVDLSGHGQSLLGSDGLTHGELPASAVARLAADTWAVLEALDVRDALVVGHSMGGMTALQLAADMPPDVLATRVSGLVLVSTTAGPFAGSRRLPSVGRAGSNAMSRAVLAADRNGVHALPWRDLRWWVSRLGFGADAPAAQVHFVVGMHTSGSARVFGELVPSLATYDVSDRIDRIELPALVIAGTHDRVLPLRHARQLAAGLPRAELVELPRCGHQPMLERRNEFNRLLDEFSAKLA
jgi:pimeloyl-ACP methyl ester carboxylesterase